MTPVDIDKLKAEASAVSARCRRANSSRQGDPILLRAADLIDALIAKAERVDALEAALEPFAKVADDPHYVDEEAGPRFMMEAHREAKAAIGRQK